MEDPKQLLVDEPPPAPLTGTLDLFDINILPLRHQRRKLQLAAILPWLVLIVLLGALYSNILRTLDSQMVFTASRDAFSDVQDTLNNYQSAAQALESIQTEIDLELVHRDEILATYQGLNLQHISLSRLFYGIESITHEGISWTSMTLNDDQIQFEGRADSYQDVLILREALVTINGLENVQIDSVDQILEEPPVVISPTEGDEAPLTNPGGAAYSFIILAMVNGEGQQ